MESGYNVNNNADLSEIHEENKKKILISIAGRFALILFIGISIYLFISTLIIIFLTRSEKEVVVPFVTGRPFLEVYDNLIRKNLIPEIKFHDVYDIDNGIILNQYPKNGTIVPEGEKIKLVVSRSKVYIPVPNLIGINLSFAINKLKNLNANNKFFSLGIGVISYMPSDKIKDNIVIDHIPGAGEEISPDRKINLLVSAGKIDADMKMPDVTGQSIDLCFDLLLARDLVVHEEIVITDIERKCGIVESQIPKAGEDISKGKQVKLKVFYYPMEEHPFTSYEKVTYTISTDEEPGIYEAYIEDSRSKRIRFHKQMTPGKSIDFVFKRTGNARVIIEYNKEIIDVIPINVDEFD